MPSARQNKRQAEIGWGALMLQRLMQCLPIPRPCPAPKEDGFYTRVGVFACRSLAQSHTILLPYYYPLSEAMPGAPTPMAESRIPALSASVCCRQMPGNTGLAAGLDAALS